MAMFTHATQDVRRPARRLPLQATRRRLPSRRKYATRGPGVLRPRYGAQVQKMLLTEHGGMNEVLATSCRHGQAWLDLLNITSSIARSRIHSSI